MSLARRVAFEVMPVSNAHSGHVRHLRGVPVAYRLIELGGKSEHVFHARDLRCSPIADRLIESGRGIKHMIHCDY